MSAPAEITKLILRWMELPTGGEGDAADAKGLAKLLKDRGFQKPRTITTAEELDALELPAIIDCKDGGVAKVEYMAGPGRQKYAEFLFGEADESHTLAAMAEWALPATILKQGIQ